MSPIRLRSGQAFALDMTKRVGRSLRFVHLRWTSVGMTLGVCHCFGRNDNEMDLEPCFRGKGRSVGLFNSVARSLRCAVLRTAPVGMTVGCAVTSLRMPNGRSGPFDFAPSFAILLRHPPSPSSFAKATKEPATKEPASVFAEATTDKSEGRPP